MRRHRQWVVTSVALLTGCANWPNFDYAPLADVLVDENEVAGAVAQNLGTLEARTIVSGSINATGLAAEGTNQQFSYDGMWYVGDVDYFAFQVGVLSDVEVSLDWPSGSTLLDVFLFRYNPETAGLDVLIDASVASDDGMADLLGEGIEAGALHIVVVAGRSGPSSAYDLSISPISLEEP